ncbi:MAG: cytochrome c biogenesis protein CcsA [Chloroflexia bacterium]|nr:cytochrome c biogenesis protein CcsA [Chloroflexia bacterium]
MEALLRDEVLAWLAALLLGGGTLVAAVGLARGPAWGRAARWCAGLGGYLLLLALLARGVRARGLPLGSAYEVLLLSAAALALFYALGMPDRLAVPAGLCAGLAATVMVVLTQWLTPAAARLPQPPPLELRGIWFPLHVLSTALGCGGLLLAGCAGLCLLLLDRPKGGGGLAGMLPAVSWRGLAWGYPWLTLGMTLGGLWGWLAWGRYWSWSVQEILTLLVWGLFTLAFHTRRLRGWSGWPHAAVLTLGLLALLLTLLAAGALLRWALPGTPYVF